MKYAWIREHRGEFPTAVMCRVLEVSTSGYYDWLRRKPSRQSLRRQELIEAITESYEASWGIYGHRKVHQDLVQDYRLECCVETVRKLMREQGMRGKQRRNFVVTTDSGHGLTTQDNKLARDFGSQAPNEKWVADITYLRTREGWLYLAVVLDLFSRAIVGWAASAAIDANLVCQALSAAVRQRCPGPGLLHHSDQGSQYASEDFQDLMELYGIVCSMSRRGNCWDNACAERFFCSLKTEWVEDKVYPDRVAAETAVFQYIEMFYNTRRRHAALGYKTPAQFEQAFTKGEADAA